MNKHATPSNKQIFILRAILLVVLAASWHVSQHVISLLKANIHYQGCLLDQTFVIFNSFNQYLNQHRALSSALMIFTSLEVDAMVLFVFFYSLFSKSARLVIGLFIVLLIRQACQLLVLLPFPENMIWYYPGFPSLFVGYDIANDFFFSAHTAVVIYGTTAMADIYHKMKYIRLIKWFMIANVCIVAVTLRFHYFMDVYTGFVTALLVYYLIQKVKLPYWLDSRPRDNFNN